jgi:hypothetical protein
MSELDSIQPASGLDAAPEELLDASSLHTVLIMLEVIDSLEDLALLETLTLAQKRQVWEATPEPTRLRLIQLRAGQTVSQPNAQSNMAQSLAQQAMQTAPTPDVSNQDFALAEASYLQSELQSEPLSEIQLETQSDWSNSLDETAVGELALLAEMDSPSSESLDFTASATTAITISIGDWVVLQPYAKLSRSELIAIWQVTELQGNSARISTETLGTRLYPVAWMIPYPKPIEIEPEF